MKDISNIPTLVIWGMEDNTVPLRDASFLVDEWPDIDLRILPRASHWPQFEAPDITQRYIKAFLGTPLKLIQAVF
jgi:pimeloyl-ACP methyl ester carboxylesterase